LKLVQDLGEDVFPEPPSPEAAAAKDGVDATSSSVESQEPASNAPSESTSSPLPASSSAPPEPPHPIAEEQDEGGRKKVTTQERQPMKIPESVHVRITPETLKDYVGPPVYQKDRMYVAAPPPGVSTGLGYLGNGSGAVMPVEAMVSSLRYVRSSYN
jgi:Lon-like ATP-dependent protease